MSSTLKVGILCHPTYGGSGVVASELALSLVQAGHQVHLFSQDVPPRLAQSSAMVEMHVAQGMPYPLFQSTPHDLAITSRILDVHREVGLDIIHAHYAIPHAVSAFLAREAARSYKEFPPPKVVTTLHGTDITLVGNDPSYASLTEHVILASDAVTAVSASLAERTREQFCAAVIPCGIEVIPNFVDLEHFSPNARRGVDCVGHSGPTAVHLSNFRPVKRVPWLIEAFALAAKGTNAHLVLVGDGPDQHECRRKAQSLGIADQVSFLGERSVLPELLAPANVFCLTSTEESFGLSALEAMSCGTAVVATDVGGVSEVVTHGKSGLLAPVDDQQTYSQLLANVLFEEGLSDKLGVNAREEAVTRFARAKVVKRYEELYLRLLDSPA
ncbi:MAG: N-acetyl-alpha-D-glucosaminyl L-malate synthase BshA [Planctomycetota bacterium]|jgi:N-acetyl-alpha-D-glucosaminyl L-malate synthase BshA